jgi:NAD(P)-dependent dehydrogenase (short-subunit alcohol dehydrogenase family)
LLAKHPRIDVLMNNVGGIMDTRHLTADGFEATFQVNHLGGFLLTNLLQDRLNASGATIINTSSFGNNLGHVDLDDLQNERGYTAMRAYGTAKLMNILHANELQRRHGDRISAASFHPGVVATGFAREGNWYTRLFYNSPVGKLFMITPERGADTMLWLATGRPGTDWTPGEYYDKRRAGQRNAQARDAALAKGLWEASERLVAPWLAAAPTP